MPKVKRNRRTTTKLVDQEEKEDQDWKTNYLEVRDKIKDLEETILALSNKLKKVADIVDIHHGHRVFSWED